MGGMRGATNGLTYDAYKFLAETLGKDYADTVCNCRSADRRVHGHAPAR